MIPIIVNEDFDIIDGQHRFFNAMDLGLPVFYIINKGYALSEVQRLNTNMANWKATDYLSGYADMGNMHYIKFREYREKYGFGFPEMRGMLSGDYSAATNELFKSGKFEIVNEEEFLEIARNMEKIAPFYAGYKRRSFVQAILALFRNENFKFDTFISKLSFQKIEDCVSKKDYLTRIEEIGRASCRERV